MVLVNQLALFYMLHPWFHTTVFSAFICAVVASLNHKDPYLGLKEWVCLCWCNRGCKFM